MKCPKCKSEQTYCFNSRAIKQGKQRRRRHRCFDCDYSFGTLELYDEDVAAFESIGKRLEEVLDRLRGIVNEEVSE